MLSEPYATQHANKQLSDADVALMCRELNNIASELQIILVARKAS